MMFRNKLMKDLVRDFPAEKLCCNGSYQADIDFMNLKRVTYFLCKFQDPNQRHSNHHGEDAETVEVFIELYKPAMCRKATKFTARAIEKLKEANFDGKFIYEQTEFSTCRSPFNLGWQGPNLFLNNWNVNQCFFLKGKTKRSRFTKLLNVIQQRNPSVEIIESKFQIDNLNKNQKLKYL